MDPSAAFMGMMHPALSAHATAERARAMGAIEQRDLLPLPPSPQAYTHTDSAGGDASSGGEQDDSSDHKPRRRPSRRRSADSLAKNTRGDPHLAEGIPKVIKVPPHVLHPPNSLEEDKPTEGEETSLGLTALVCKRARQHVLAQVKAWANQIGFLVHLKGTAEGNAFLISCHRYGKTNERNPARCGCQWVVRYVYDTDTCTAYIRSFPHHDHNHPVGKDHTQVRSSGAAAQHHHHHGHHHHQQQQQQQQQQPQPQQQQQPHQSQHQPHHQATAQHAQAQAQQQRHAMQSSTEDGHDRRLLGMSPNELAYYAAEQAQALQLDGAAKAAAPSGNALRKRRRGGQWSEEDGHTTPDSPTARPQSAPGAGKVQDAHLENAWHKAKNWSYTSDWHRKMLATLLERLPVLMNDVHVRHLLQMQESHLYGMPEHLPPRPFHPQAFPHQPGEFLAAPHFDPAQIPYPGAGAGRGQEAFDFAGQVARGERTLPPNFEAYSDPRFAGARYRGPARMWPASQPPELLGGQVMPLRPLDGYPEAAAAAAWNRVGFVPQHHLHAQPVARVHTPPEADVASARPSSAAHDQASAARSSNPWSEV